LLPRPYWGLSPITLTNDTPPGYSNLKRGSDYFVRYWRQGPHFRRKLFFTEEGLLRLRRRSYRVFRPGPLSPSQRAFLAGMDEKIHWPKKEDQPDRVKLGSNPLAVNRRVRDEAARVMRECLEHPCAVPNCRCMTHRLGLPTLAELVAAGYFAAQLNQRGDDR